MTHDRLLKTALVAGNAALIVVAVQLIRVAPHARNSAPSEINAGVISGSYYPAAFKTPNRPAGVVILDALTDPGNDYAVDSTVITRLERAAGASAARALIKSFRSENKTRTSVELVRRNFASQIVLDSATARRYLTHPSSDDVPPDVAGLTHGKQRLGILGLSRPGFLSDGTLAIVFARLRLPASESEQSMERASLVLLRRNQNSWAISDFWSLSLKPKVSDAR